MELLLNLAWLLVTIISSVVLLRCARMQPDSAKLWLMVTAVVCIMILLFPVISMTDDLHAELFTAEESGKRWVAAIYVQQLAVFVHALAAWLLISLALPVRTDRWASSDVVVPRRLAGIRAAWFTRPPPPLSLA